MDFPQINNFTINSLLDKTACYTSYSAADQDTGNPVILKVIDPDLIKDEKEQQLFNSNARVAKMLVNKHVCRVLDFGSDPDSGHFYIVNAHHDLKKLSELILEEFSLSLEDLLDIFISIGKTLRHAHLHGVLHGLLNPDSIYINTDGQIKIDDFGFNWAIPHLLKKNKKQNLFLAQYIAPDYYEGFEKVDGRSDIYSLGLILNEIISGKPAFSGTTVNAIKTQHLDIPISTANVQKVGLPFELGSFISRSTNTNINNRIQNFKQFLSIIEAIKENHATPSGSSDVEPISETRTFPRTPIQPSTQPQISTSSSFINKRLIFSGAGAIFLVILILFVTNYIPSHFGDQQKSTIEPEEELITLKDENLLPRSEGISETNGSEETQIIEDDNSENESFAKDTASETQEPEQSSLPTEEINTETTPIVNESPVITSSVTFLVQSDRKPIQANVYLNNNRIGLTDKSGKIAINDLTVNNTYKVRVTRRGYSSYSGSVNVTENNRLQRVNINPIRANTPTGTLILDANPIADKIYVDGKLHKGLTPIRISLANGKHTVKLVNSAINAEYEQTVDLKAKQILRIKHDFTKLISGKVAVTLENAAQFGFGYVYVDGKLWPEKNNTTPIEITLPIGVHKIALRRPGFRATPAEITVTVDREKTVTAAFRFFQTE